MAAIGFPVERWGDPIKGTLPADMRQMVASMFHSFGVIRGCAVTTSPTAMAYAVAAGVAVGSRGSSYGAMLSNVEAGTVATGAAPSSGSRIDVVYAKQGDPSQGDSDGYCTLGVAQGSAGASPVKPAVPTGGIELASYVIPAGINTTSGATRNGFVRQAIPYGASMGVLLDKTDMSYKEVSQGAPYVFATGSINLPTARTVQVKLTETTWAYHPSTHDWIGSGYVDWTLDGVVMRAFRFTNYPDTPTSQCFEDIVEIPAGSHAISARLWGSGTAPISDIWLDYAPGSWPGQRIAVVDLGVAI